MKRSFSIFSDQWRYNRCKIYKKGQHVDFEDFNYPGNVGRPDAATSFNTEDRSCSGKKPLIKLDYKWSVDIGRSGGGDVDSDGNVLNSGEFYRTRAIRDLVSMIDTQSGPYVHWWKDGELHEDNTISIYKVVIDWLVGDFHDHFDPYIDPGDYVPIDDLWDQSYIPDGKKKIIRYDFIGDENILRTCKIRPRMFHRGYRDLVRKISKYIFDYNYADEKDREFSLQNRNTLILTDSTRFLQSQMKRICDENLDCGICDCIHSNWETEGSAAMKIYENLDSLWKSATGSQMSINFLNKMCYTENCQRAQYITSDDTFEDGAKFYPFAIHPTCSSTIQLCNQTISAGDITNMGSIVESCQQCFSTNDDIDKNCGFEAYDTPPHIPPQTPVKNTHISWPIYVFGGVVCFLIIVILIILVA